MVRAQRPVRGFGPFCGQSCVLEDGNLEVEGLAVACPPVEPVAFMHGVVFRRVCEGAGFHSRLGRRVAVAWVEAHCARSLTVRLAGWLGCRRTCAFGRVLRR